MAIDVGGSKTLLASFNYKGKIQNTYKYPTPKSYQDFLHHLKKSLIAKYRSQDFFAVCCAMPGVINRQKGLALRFGNLAWEDVPVRQDLQKIFPKASIYVENDANLAGLSEAKLVHKKYKKILYLTISTGIGDGIIIDGKIDPSFADSEAGQMLISRGSQIQRWEDFASGRALINRFGKMAKDINDPHIWKLFAKDLAAGINELLAIVQPQLVIIGGSVGVHFDKFGKFLNTELTRYPSKLYEVPPVIKAQRPTLAVIYGCYEYIKQNQ